MATRACGAMATRGGAVVTPTAAASAHRRLFHHRTHASTIQNNNHRRASLSLPHNPHRRGAATTRSAYGESQPDGTWVGLLLLLPGVSDSDWLHGLWTGAYWLPSTGCVFLRTTITL
jgi:hypothetical protein